MDEVNALGEGEFVARFGGVFEHSPWAAERAWQERPFSDLFALHGSFVKAVREAPLDWQLALIRAHPDLAGKAAVAGELSPESAREQASAGLDRLTPEEYGRFQSLNEAYREKFGFPLIIAVRDHTRETIFASAEARLGHSREEEIETALSEIARIAYFRLQDQVEPGARDDREGG